MKNNPCRNKSEFIAIPPCSSGGLDKVQTFTVSLEGFLVFSHTALLLELREQLRY